MVKECKVLIWNECVMVIDFDGIEVQMPSINKCDFVYVKYDNEKYSIVDENEYQKSLTKEVKVDVKKESMSDEK